MRHKPLAHLAERAVVAHREAEYAFEIRLVDIAARSEVCVGDFSTERDFAGYVEAVDGL